MDIVKIAEGVIVDGKKLSDITTREELIDVLEQLEGASFATEKYMSMDTQTLIKAVIDVIVEEVKNGKAERKSDGYAIERFGVTRKVEIDDFRKELEGL